MSVPDDLKYTKSHEWVRIDGSTATVGITQHAEEELGDVALVMLPEVGRALQVDEKFGEVESIKAVSDLYSPIAGTVTEVNETLVGRPEAVNDDPYGDGWMIKINLTSSTDGAELLDPAAYSTLIQES